jgi:hypothetical protein
MRTDVDLFTTMSPALYHDVSPTELASAPRSSSTQNGVSSPSSLTCARNRHEVDRWNTKSRDKSTCHETHHEADAAIRSGAAEDSRAAVGEPRRERHDIPDGRPSSLREHTHMHAQ